MRKVVLLFFALIPFALFANENYEINLSNVDIAINKAVETTYSNLNLQSGFKSNKMQQISDKNATTAFVLGILVGELGIHRLYLGTTIGVFIVYLVSGSGCGVLYFIDNALLLIALLQDTSIDTYIDNPHLFMWMQ